MNLSISALWSGVVWTTFEKVWLALFTTINLIVFAINPDGWLGLVASLSGMFCVVLAAKAHIGTYAFGTIQAITYGYLSYTFAIYGEVMLNVLFYLPMQIVGFAMWRANKANREGTQTVARKMDLVPFSAVMAGSILAVIAYAYLLNILDGAVVGLDAITTVLSIVAQLLMVTRFSQQWMLWIIVNIVSIIMWVIIATTGDPGLGAWSMVVMWSAFLANSVYGYINWTTMAKNNIKENINV